jgi:hypothetical protein
MSLESGRAVPAASAGPAAGRRRHGRGPRPRLTGTWAGSAPGPERADLQDHRMAGIGRDRPVNTDLTLDALLGTGRR